MDNQWDTGFTATVQVTAGAAPVTGWTVTWTWAGGQQETSAWSADVTQTGASVTAKNLSYNGALARRRHRPASDSRAPPAGSLGAPALTCTAS